jgi:hypothetical protein
MHAPGLPRIALAAALALLAGCSPAERTPEDRLRSAIDAMLEATEAGDPKPILERLSPRFASEASAEQPSLDYGAARSIVLEFLLRDEMLGARAEEIRIHPAAPDGRRRVEAEVSFARGVSLHGAEHPLPPGAARYRFDLSFAPGGPDFMVEGGRFERLKP